jgi:hypothetical protein
MEILQRVEFAYRTEQVEHCCSRWDYTQYNSPIKLVYCQPMQSLINYSQLLLLFFCNCLDIFITAVTALIFSVAGTSTRLSSLLQ